MFISPVKTRRLSGELSSTSLYKPVATPVCIFCDEIGDKQESRKASTFGLDKRVRDCAYLIGDKCQLCKLSSDNMVAIDAVYHRACLTQFYQSPLILTELFQHNLINVSYLTACYLYQVMMTLHFLNDVANDAESTQKSKITS